MKLKQCFFLVLFLQCTVSTTSTRWSKTQWVGDDEKDVIVLTGNNFTEFISRNRYVMVNFCIPFCSWCKKLTPEYAAAATILKSSAVLAKVDCSEETKLGGEFRIHAYPTMYFFFGGDKTNFLELNKTRTRDAIVNWAHQKINNAVQNLTSIDEVERVLASNKLLVLGFLDSLQGEDSEVLSAVAKQNIDVIFYQTSNADVAKLFHIEEPKMKRPALVMLERESEIHTYFEGQFTVSEIADFVSINKLPSFITLTKEDAPRILKNPMKQVWLFTPEYSLEVISVFKEVAKIFKGKLLIVHVDTSEEGPRQGRQFSYEFGITEGAPTVVAYDAVMSKHHVHHGELTIIDIKSFAEEFLEDNFLDKSSTNTLVRLPVHPQPHPTLRISTTSTRWSKTPQVGADEKDVVVLTGNNFTEFISRNRYVMVNFCAPFYSRCKKLAPEYAAAAKILKSSAVLAKVDDSEESQLGGEFRIDDYPTMYFFFGGDQMNFYEFTQGRTRDAISNWVYHKINNVVQNLTSIDDAECVLAPNSLIVLAFLHSLQGEESEVLAAVAKQNIDVKFYQTSNADVAKLFHIEVPQIKRPALVMLERESEIHTYFEGQFTVSEIADFVSINKLPSFITLTKEEAPRILKNPMKQLWLFTSELSSEVISVLKEVAKIFKGKLLIVLVDTSEEGPRQGRQFSYEFGIIKGAPRVVAYDAKMSKHHVHDGELTISDIKSFAEEFLEDNFPGESSMNTLVGLPFHHHPHPYPTIRNYKKQESYARNII
ncbi:Protein disulfide isomerase-like 1-4 [Euphorbia peplus]|nr:Protein disulfide isomerase-like 1-4 [Euphorbia peplus]